MPSSSLGLFTDLYALTMAYGYWKRGIMEREAVFTLFFRRAPFQGSFAIAAGLESAVELIENFHFSDSDLSYLASLKTQDGNPLFERGFLEYLSKLQLSCDVEAIEEGTAVFPYEPLLKVKGPILQAQLLESALLNTINFQTLIATKSSRICVAAEGDEVVEFGLRRAQGIDGALSAARAAYIGGCCGTSNTMAGKRFGIPVKGTQAHSWIMAFDEEKEAFDAYAQVMPNHCLFLIDTYNTVQGVKKAMEVVRNRPNVKMLGVRIDSGDLAQLSRRVRLLLDEGGFPDAKIMASNELDEKIIRDLKQQGAKINLWGVGTNLITAKDQPALDGVYKLTAIQDEQGKWKDKIKISEQLSKTTNPGILQVRRFWDKDGRAFADMIYDVRMPLTDHLELVNPMDSTLRQRVSDLDLAQDLLIPIFRRGVKVYDCPKLSAVRENTSLQIKKLSPEVRRFLHPQPYFVGLEQSLYDRKMGLIAEMKL